MDSHYMTFTERNRWLESYGWTRKEFDDTYENSKNQD